VQQYHILCCAGSTHVTTWPCWTWPSSTWAAPGCRPTRPRYRSFTCSTAASSRRSPCCVTRRSAGRHSMTCFCRCRTAALRCSCQTSWPGFTLTSHCPSSQVGNLKGACSHAFEVYIFEFYGLKYMYARLSFCIQKRHLAVKGLIF